MNAIYKWLPIIMGCHRRPDRSFFWKGKQFPVCARCTGILVGFLLSILTYPFWHPAIWILFLLLVPLIVDGSIQQLVTFYESNNIRRLFTGILCGYGALSLLFAEFIFMMRVGNHLGQQLIR